MEENPRSADIEAGWGCRLTGPFGPEQAERLLWRAGFGPRPRRGAGAREAGLDGAVRSLTQPAGEQLDGPAPHDDRSRRSRPTDAWGHDHLWWLDRMVRTTAPLVERMTLVWHDWFATSNAGVGSQRLMLDQNKLFRRYALGSFRDAAHERDDATRRCCSGSPARTTRAARRTRTTAAR